MKNCKYWPTDKEIEAGLFSGVCGAGSEIGGLPCTEQDEKECEHAFEQETRDNEI
jgi:hypothetical protein